MEIVYRITFDPTWLQQRALTKLGLPVTTGLQTILVSNLSPRASEITEYAERSNFVVIRETNFSPDELANSDYLCFASSWHNGYPLPEDNYKDTLYNEILCSVCKIGDKQVAPFRLKGEPTWKSRNIMGLNWVFDEIFVRPELYEAVFSNFGIPSWPVIEHGSGKTLTNVVQLDIPSTEANFAFSTLPENKCEACGRPRRSQAQCGYWPELRDAPDLPIFKAVDVFGEGWMNRRQIVITNKLYETLIEAKVKGCYFEAITNRS